MEPLSSILKVRAWSGEKNDRYTRYKAWALTETSPESLIDLGRKKIFRKGVGQWGRNAKRQKELV